MLKIVVKQTLERFPSLYLRLLKIKRTGHWSQRWIVCPETAITIEGFPRSGNSFARAAFMKAQPEKVRIATHVHSAAQVRHSVKLGVPTMVLLRAPADACLSLVALDYEVAGKKTEEISTKAATLSLIRNLEAYRRFYEDTLDVYDSVVMADFSLVTTEYGEVIRRVNEKYGTHFTRYENSRGNDAELFEKGGFHLSPNENRNAIKATIKTALESEAVGPALKQAEELYKEFCGLEDKKYGENYG